MNLISRTKLLAVITALILAIDVVYGLYQWLTWQRFLADDVMDGWIWGPDAPIVLPLVAAGGLLISFAAMFSFKSAKFRTLLLFSMTAFGLWLLWDGTNYLSHIYPNVGAMENPVSIMFWEVREACRFLAWLIFHYWYFLKFNRATGAFAQE